MADAFDAGYTEYQSQRSWLRKTVRRAYLESARRLLNGPTLDFGCGIGELLARLPPGSIGIEYNEATVAYCRERGLDVRWYDGVADEWRLSLLSESDGLKSMVISHVLEHFETPMDVLSALLAAAERLGIERVLVIVPGRAGYRIDPTHRTFIDRQMLEDDSVVAASGFGLMTARHFPIDIRALGDFFPHHELQALFRRPV